MYKSVDAKFLSANWKNHIDQMIRRWSMLCL